MEKTIKVYFPRWAIALYATAAIILIPWIYDLAINLPARHLERHWDVVWVGFDMILLCNIILTLWFLARRVVWVVVSASSLATLLIVDAWFDIMTARQGKEVREAILYGVIELTLAVLTYRLVYVVIHNSAPEKSFSLHVREKKKADSLRT